MFIELKLPFVINMTYGNDNVSMRSVFVRLYYNRKLKLLHSVYMIRDVQCYNKFILGTYWYSLTEVLTNKLIIGQIQASLTQVNPRISSVFKKKLLLSSNK
ncbi:hypothetical protein WA026_009492 [Henosepilachna vigintioctopunctata]|uniref:Uncharacterized protein n=1 Tax=Henosepilachna vigintioctopunctata TaxID=420089 RepID=A0AAW1TZJ3_9CUCU